MMNNNNKIDEIKKVLERIRAEKYSDVPADIVEKIVDVQVNHNEDSEYTEAYNEIKSIVNNDLFAQLLPLCDVGNYYGT